MIQYENRGTHTSQNIADPLLGFNSLSTWTSIGTGSASIFNTDYFHGSGCLKIQNTAWGTTDLTVSNSSQATTILIDGEYDFSLYVKKELARDVDLTLEITQTQGGVSNVIYDATINMLTEDIDDWVSFITNHNFRLLAGDIITFRFGIPANASAGVSNVYVLMDGFHVFNKERKQLEAPIYTQPIGSEKKEYFGIYDYNDLSTQTTPISFTGTDVVLSNDGLGTFTNTNFGLSDITNVFNTTTNVFDWSGLELGDSADIRLDVDIITTSVNQEVTVYLELGQGSFPYPVKFIKNKLFKTAGLNQNEGGWNSIYIGDLNTLSNPSQFKFTSDSDATIVVNGWYVRTMKRLV